MEAVWRSLGFRMAVNKKLQESIAKYGNCTDRDPDNMEEAIFNRAKTKDEYLEYAARIILYLKEQHHRSRVEEIKSRLNGSGSGSGSSPAAPTDLRRIVMRKRRSVSESDAGSGATARKRTLASLGAAAATNQPEDLSRRNPEPVAGPSGVDRPAVSRVTNPPLLNCPHVHPPPAAPPPSILSAGVPQPRAPVDRMSFRRVFEGEKHRDPDAVALNLSTAASRRRHEASGSGTSTPTNAGPSTSSSSITTRG